MPVYFDFNGQLNRTGRTPAWLARASGVGLRQIEQHQARKTKRFRFVTLERLCRALGCQPGDILILEDERERSSSRGRDK